MRAGQEQQESWGRIATLMWVLSWCVILGVGFSIDGVTPFTVPVGLLAAESLRRLATLLDRPAARRYLEWAMVATGGVVVSGALLFPASSRDAARVASLLTVSGAMSLYALGLAAWTARIGDGNLARRLRCSVVAWWVAVAFGALGYATGADAAVADEASSGWGLDPSLGRDFNGAWAVPALGAYVVAFYLLARSHHIIRTSLRALADEAEPRSGVRVG